MKSVLLIFILLCLSMLNIRCLLMSLVYFYYVFFVLFWFITLWLRHVIVRPFFIFDYMNSLSHLCVAMFPASLLDHDLHWFGLYCASILLMAILLQAMFTIVFEAPIHNNVYCASSLRKECQGCSAYHHVQQYFSYIVVGSFIVGWNRSTQRKPPTCRRSLTNFIT